MPFGMERAAETIGSVKNGNGYKGGSGIAEEVVGAQEEAGTKTRGRPRVDTQSFYYSPLLEPNELKGTNEEMCNIFIGLYDFNVGKGLLQREPEFGQQHQLTTGRFLPSAKASSSYEDSHDENSEGPQKRVNSMSDRRLRGSRKSPSERPEKEH
ncbi:hypothetical protein MBM_05988 [Drepanopeziza brunnea f. sp. 'multigermtubi' MB_m1]|uniref:Uncharacterized protein n=1 Tax=Marssonina brunnea f. sp. multigermtubi (strain MB_m1) TaxID=1072389 RepID=K1WU34_MARBU|nr:uncharacterized protein MBM_05988 [Drepanopeziza brunnea f. sp. 'multigermtubi' MB_m1]EKD15977.1 hypothetical protein MBM_05988 [Drepanopeziza brunnea f. sp. 'multigermtubi' MB_m1]